MEVKLSKEFSRNIKVTWCTSADLDVSIDTISTGGQFYEMYLKKILEKYFSFSFMHLEKRSPGNIFKKIGKRLSFARKVSNLHLETDILLTDSAVGSSIPLNSSSKKIALIHYMGLKRDHTGIGKRVFYRWLDSKFYSRFHNIDIIVTVSRYWENIFRQRGHKDVRVIHNSFDLKHFEFEAEEIERFKKSYDLQKKPIIYLGLCEKQKGVEDAFKALNGIDAYLVTSGRRNVNLPTIHLKISYRDYLRLLKASSIVISVSQLEESWNRITHEAMLCKTPVIGARRGGMTELLEGGGQIICDDLSELREKVETLLNAPQKKNMLGQKGYEFAKKFDLHYFEKEWITLITELAKESVRVAEV